MASASPSVDAHEPFSSASYILQCPQVKRYSDVPFKFKATRFSSTLPESRLTGAHTVNLLLTCAIGGSAEWWVPLLRRLFSEQHSSAARVGAAWVVEAPNHGDGGVLNEVLLRSHYKEVFPMSQYGAAIKALLESPHMHSGDRTNLVAVTHSAGVAALFFAMPIADLSSNFSSIFMIEGTEIPSRYLPYLAHHVNAYKAYNKARPATWGSYDDAVKFLRTREPWKAFHPEAFDQLCRTYFTTTESGAVVTKTPLEQESATWADFENAFEFERSLEAAAGVIPMHIVVGAVRKLWSKKLEEALTVQHQMLERRGATSTVIDGAGHYIPQEKPDELSRVILDILVRMPTTPRARL
ncbi:hypothetical protein FA95DRAFT_1277707 [Auriscalpium vulgare]|uniref:Uncharacterized protein n=1 Tax=Auriscalpium vulgare TaxID=40419 RepID=A0ACB8RUA2_9AGAM|nr:hypothetical protein FA95DRAFT_1277707 [Auriscalpium vulgare]